MAQIKPFITQGVDILLPLDAHESLTLGLNRTDMG